MCVPEVGLEPTSLTTADFESTAVTNFATPAMCTKYYNDGHCTMTTLHAPILKFQLCAVICSDYG